MCRVNSTAMESREPDASRAWFTMAAASGADGPPPSTSMQRTIFFGFVAFSSHVSTADTGAEMAGKSLMSPRARRSAKSTNCVGDSGNVSSINVGGTWLARCFLYSKLSSRLSRWFGRAPRGGDLGLAEGELGWGVAPEPAALREVLVDANFATEANAWEAAPGAPTNRRYGCCARGGGRTDPLSWFHERHGPTKQEPTRGLETRWRVEPQLGKTEWWLIATSDATDQRSPKRNQQSAFSQNNSVADSGQSWLACV